MSGSRTNSLRSDAAGLSAGTPTRKQDVVGPPIEGLPVAGYRAQTGDTVALVNANKIAEERVLRILDALAARDDVDKRWLAIGRSAIENGFMAVNRAVFQPGRVELSDEAA